MRLVPMVCAALVVTAPFGSAGAASASTKPRLALSVVQPATVRGTHFAALERVRVSFSAGGGASVRTVRSTSTGAFVAPAPAGFTYSPCGAPLLVTAVGARGDRATLKLAQRECPSP